MGVEGRPGDISAELFSRLDDLWYENYAGWARAHPRGRVEQSGGWRIASLGSSWPFYNVATAVVGKEVEPSRLGEVFAAVGGYRVWLRDGMAAAEAVLLGEGFSSDLEVPAYLLELRGRSVAPSQITEAGATAVLPGGYELSQALTRSEVEECVWGDRSSPWMGVDDAKAVFPDPWAMARGADRRFYQARQSGQLVATGQSLLHAGVLGVHGMWTADGHRFQGLARAILQRILADGAAAGADHATLQATHVGGGLYAAAGFRPGYAYRVYRDRHGDA